MRARQMLTVPVVAALVLGGFAAGRLPRATADETERPPATAPADRGTLPSFAELAAQVSPAVVHVQVVTAEKVARTSGFPSPNPFDPSPPEQFGRHGAGSGLIIGQNGVILTNEHVVADAKEITVTLGDKREYVARVLGRDPKTDLAVLKIEPTGTLPVVTLGDSDALRVGDWVMAIGNPFGLSNTVTVGIVSAKARVIGAGPYDDFIQTDAPINPGNSGGPLFNERGEVVGINSVIFSRSGGNIGIGFAIPINLAKRLVPELETHGHVTRGWLGVSIQAMTKELAESLGIDPPHGALVADVTADSPADEAGLRRGDVITAYDGKAVEESHTLPSLVAGTPVGTTVPVEVVRGGRITRLHVTVGKLDEPVARDDTPHEQGSWGLALRDLRPEERERLGLADDEGVLVVGVQPGSPAAEAEVEVGTVVLEVNRTPVDSVAAVRRQLEKIAAGKRLLLLMRSAEGGNRFAALAPRVG